MSRSESKKGRRGKRDAAAPTTSRLAQTFAGKWPIFRFVLIFAVCMALFYAFRLLPWFTDHVWIPYLRINATISAWILSILGEQATASNLSVFSPRFSLEIAQGCDAVEPSALFAAAVIAFPAGFKRTSIGLIVGVAVLMFMNLVRIISLYYTGVHWPSAFETMHIDVWQPVFILLAMVLWIVWAGWATRPPKQTESS